jgi:phosphate transport system substrate-binding protein
VTLQNNGFFYRVMAPLRVQLVALVVLLWAMMLSRPAAALTLRGSGVKFGSEMASGWATSYGYDRDDIALVFGVAANQSDAAAMYDKGLSDFYTTFVSVDATISDPQRLQIPLAGLAIVPAYRLDALGTTLRLNATILGKIWAGQITNWNDSAIAALNTGAPDLPIVLVFDPLEELSGGLADAFKQALAAISSDFAASLASNGPGLSDALTAAGVTNFRTASSSTSRVNVTSANDGCLTYAGLPEVVSVSPIKRASMVRNGTTTVTASSTSVTTAISDFTARIVNSTTGRANIFNPPSTAAWPLSTIYFVSMRKDRTIPGKKVACQYIEETLLFLSWTQLNDKAVAVTNSLNYVGLPFGYRKKACSLLEQMTCNNRATLTTGLIVGSGAANDVYPPLAYKYPSASFQLKYYGSTTTEGIGNMVNANFDFGIISSSLPSYVSQSIPDIGALPITAMAIVPIYNLPELVGRPEPLVLSLSLMGDIYLGVVTHWNDSQILALNPDLADVLPYQPIRIVYQDMFSVITIIYAKAMAQSNPAFNQTVGVGNVIDFPMKNASSTILLYDFLITETVSANPYSFTPWVNNVVSSERSLAVAKLRNVAGNDVAISQETITAALNDLIVTGDNDLINAPSANSWPVLSINSIIIRQSSMTDCARATSLLDWIYWTQNSSTLFVTRQPFPRPVAAIANTHTNCSTAEALNQIVISGMGVVANSDLIRRQMYKFLMGVTCQGQHVSSLYGCVTGDGLLCSDHGSCVNSACRCFDGYEGSLCESVITDSSSTDTTAILIGVTVPLAVLIFLILLAIIIALLMRLQVKKRCVHPIVPLLVFVVVSRVPRT